MATRVWLYFNCCELFSFFFCDFWCVANPKTMCDKPVPPEGERSAQVLHRGVCGAHQVWPRYRARGASPGKTRCAEQGFPFQSKWEVPSPPEHASWWQHQGTITRWFVFLWRSGASLVLRMLGQHSTILRLHFLPTVTVGVLALFPHGFASLCDLFFDPSTFVACLVENCLFLLFCFSQEHFF